VARVTGPRRGAGRGEGATGRRDRGGMRRTGRWTRAGGGGGAGAAVGMTRWRGRREGAAGGRARGPVANTRWGDGGPAGSAGSGNSDQSGEPPGSATSSPRPTDGEAGDDDMVRRLERGRWLRLAGPGVGVGMTRWQGRREGARSGREYALARRGVVRSGTRAGATGAVRSETRAGAVGGTRSGQRAGATGAVRSETRAGATGAGPSETRAGATAVVRSRDAMTRRRAARSGDTRASAARSGCETGLVAAACTRSGAWPGWASHAASRQAARAQRKVGVEGGRFSDRVSAAATLRRESTGAHWPGDSLVLIERSARTWGVSLVA
jgi:hypothetical protein